MCAVYKDSPQVSIDTSQERVAYETPLLTEAEMEKSPFVQFERWYQVARAEERIEEVNAMCLSTCSKEGCPSSRMVLMKKFSQEGLTFFSNRESRKGVELVETGRAAVLFYWAPLKRQVRVEGRVESATEAEADEYWASRPLLSRLTAIVSEQSKRVGSREELERRREAARGGEAAKRPSHWGGYVVIPDYFEFWQGHSDRLHDRFEYRREVGGGWSLARLQP